MASVTEYGEVNDPLSGPALGGPNGWAAAVAAALDNRDESVDVRLATLEDALQVLIAEKVAKSGDEMTGALTLNGGDLYTANGQTRMAFWSDGALLPVAVATPTASNQAATKEYADGVAATFTPRIIQNGVTLTNGAIYRNMYWQLGPFVHFELAMVVGSNSTGTGSILVRPPVPAQVGSGSGWSIGNGGMQVTGGNYPVSVYRQPAANSDFYLFRQDDPGSPVLSTQLKTGDVLRIGGDYLAGA